MGFNTEILSYPSSNGKDTICAEMLVPTEMDIRGIVQISHGMCEYFRRYRPFAEFLCQQGFLVCGNDHLGHGRSVTSTQDLGFFAPKDGWCFLIRDLYTLTTMLQERYPSTPYFLMGHSMGSFIARCYMTKYASVLDGVILSGTGGPAAVVGAGRRIADTFSRMQGPNKRNKLLDAMAFGHYNDRFSRRTEKDWLSRDQAVVDAFVNDPYCSFTFTNSAYRDLSTLISLANSSEWAKGLPKDLPVYLFSGDQDPVGDYGKGVRQVCQMLKSAGLFDVSFRLYKGGRHEMLNELNHDEVYADILAWLKRKI